VKFRRCAGHATVEWVLCAPVLILLITGVFGFLFLTLAQFNLESLCVRAADRAAGSDAITTVALESEVSLWVSRRIAKPLSVRVDRHEIEELPSTTNALRAPIEVVGVELTDQDSFRPIPLRAYARAARVR
jgi:hypothetical protein